MISLILPAYNEARRLPMSLRRCAEFLRARRLAAEIIVADDGSADATADVVRAAAGELRSAGLEVRRLALPHHGKGAAVRAGVLAARGDPVVFLDADLTIPVEIVDHLLRVIGDGAEIAIASRYVRGSRVHRPWWRRALGDAYRLLVRAIVPTGIEDTQCGGKAYTARAARSLFSRQRLDGFAFDAEVLFIARRAGYRLVEVPVDLRQSGESSIGFMRESPRMLRDLFLIRWNAWLGRYG